MRQGEKCFCEYRNLVNSDRSLIVLFVVLVLVVILVIVVIIVVASTVIWAE